METGNNQLLGNFRISLIVQDVHHYDFVVDHRWANWATAISERKKIVKLTDHTYAYNSLTNFEYEYIMNGNGKY